MLYTDIQTLRGLDKPVDYGSGIEYGTGLAEAYPNAGIQIGLWLNGTGGCRDVVSGKLDDNIKQLVYYLGVTSPASKIFLRIGYGEFMKEKSNYVPS